MEKFSGQDSHPGICFVQPLLKSFYTWQCMQKYSIRTVEIGKQAITIWKSNEGCVYCTS